MLKTPITDPSYSCRPTIRSEILWNGNYHWVVKCGHRDMPIARSSSFPRAMIAVIAHQWLTVPDDSLEGLFR